MSSLSGAQKAALLMLQMGTACSAKVLRLLPENEVAEISAEIARLQGVKNEVVDDVMDEFRHMLATRATITTGGIDMARNMLEAGLGHEKATEIIDRVLATMAEVPFEFLRKADPKAVLGFIQDEHPQIITLVLAHMAPDMAAMVLGGLNEDLQRDVAHRLAVMDRTSPEVIEEVQRQLERKLSSVLQPTEMAAVGGVQSLVEILNRTDRTTERGILEWLEENNTEIAEEVRQRMFLFGDVVTLEDKSIQLILRQVDTRELAVALKGVGLEVRDKIVRNMSQRAAQNLIDEIDMLGAVRIKQVEEAQGSIIRIIRALEESGQLVLTRGADEFVV